MIDILNSINMIGEENLFIISVLKIIVAFLIIYPALKFYKKEQKIMVGPIFVGIALIVNLILCILYPHDIISGVSDNYVLQIMRIIAFAECSIVEIYGVFSYIKYMRETKVGTRVIYILILIFFIVLEMYTDYLYKFCMNFPQ